MLILHHFYYDDYSSTMFKISIQRLKGQERSDAETAQQVISQTFIYWPCAAPGQQSQYLHLHNFISYVTAVYRRIYRNQELVKILSLCPVPFFFPLPLYQQFRKGHFLFETDSTPVHKTWSTNKWFVKSVYWFTGNLTGQHKNLGMNCGGFWWINNGI